MSRRTNYLLRAIYATIIALLLFITGVHFEWNIISYLIGAASAMLTAALLEQD